MQSWAVPKGVSFAERGWFLDDPLDEDDTIVTTMESVNAY